MPWTPISARSFLRFCSYFPCNAKLCLNGNHWAQRQADAAGLPSRHSTNGFAAPADPASLHATCDQFGPAQIDALLRKWLARLPHPFTALQPAGFTSRDLRDLTAART